METKLFSLFAIWGPEWLLRLWDITIVPSCVPRDRKSVVIVRKLGPKMALQLWGAASLNNNNNNTFVSSVVCFFGGKWILVQQIVNFEDGKLSDFNTFINWSLLLYLSKDAFTFLSRFLNRKRKTPKMSLGMISLDIRIYISNNYVTVRLITKSRLSLFELLLSGT